MGVCVQDSGELKDILAAVGHQGKELCSIMSVISLGDVMTECLSIFWRYTCLLLSIHFGGTDHITETTRQINQCIHVDAESVSGSFLTLSFALPSLTVCLSLSLPCYHSLSILFAVWGHYIYSIADRYQVCVSFPSMLTAV